MALIVLIVFLSVYLFPTIIAKWKKRKQYEAIAILNIFLGWTVIGWVAALIWAAMTD